LHGADIVAGAARLVAAENPSIKFKMIGEGRTLQAARAAAAGAENLEFVGRMSLSALARAVEAADLCLGIFGSTEKAQRVVPHKIFQSMAMGKAVVTLRTPAVEEFFARDREIVFCDEPSAGALARIILDLAGDRARRERVARAGFARVRCDFTPEAVARRLVGIAAARFGMAFSPVNLVH
jgi:glycosyltransferase involved in cell wall biosynthesis